MISSNCLDWDYADWMDYADDFGDDSCVGRCFQPDSPATEWPSTRSPGWNDVEPWDMIDFEFPSPERAMLIPATDSALSRAIKKCATR
jgi:hypothetical protein